MTESEGSGVRDPPPSYMIFLVVFLFFLTGLLGFLVCHLLKKKGYRCRTGDMEDEEEEEKLGENADDENDENQDTVEQILKCIIENEANMEAFNEMLGNHNVCVRHDPRLRKESIGGVPPHLHTVHSGTDHNSCLLCAQVQSKKGRRQSRTPRFKQRPGEQTVFSVGRFRVTHTDKKLHGGPLAISGDQLDQSQDSDERKDGRQNLKSMFKDVRLPSEGSNANMGKQKKSVTIFGLRRGSDPLGLKVKEGTGRQTGGVKFAFQQPPVVLEEPLQAENTEGDSKQSTEPGSKPKTEPTLSQHEVKISDSVNSPSIQTKKPAPDLSTDPQDGPKLGLSPKPDETMMTRPSVQSMVATAPTSLPILSEKRVNVDDVVLKTEEANITGPLQTSTPIALMPASMSSFTSGIPPGQPKLHSNKDVLVAQTSSDPCFSPDQEVCSGAGLALISLGSSPQSSFPIKTLSSVSSLKTPTSSLNESPSPKSSSRNMESEAAKAVPVSPQPLPSSPADKNLSLTRSPHPTFKLENETKGHLSSSSASMKDQKLEEQTILKTDEKTDTIRAGISKTDKLSPVDSKGFGLFLPSDQIFKDRLSSSPLSPSSSLDPSSPKGSRISSVAIVKASPDSKREFSVVTIVDEEVSCTSVKDQEKETREHDFKPENKEISSAVKEQRDCPVSSIRESENQSRETSEVEIWSTPGQGTDDLAGIEDIIHCKVPQVEGAPRLEEESEKVTHTHLKQDEERRSQKNEEFDPEKKRSDTTD